MLFNWVAYGVTFMGTLAVCVLFHEFGHFAAARFAGMTVHEFALGMGRAFYSRTCRSGMIFSLRVLPVGGFCRIAGMGDEKDGETYAPGTGFRDKGCLARMFVLGAGCFMNLVLAVLLVIGASYIDVPLSFDTRIGTVEPGGVAGRAGLRRGDEIVRIGDKKTIVWPHVRREFARRLAVPNPGISASPFEIEVRRNGAGLVLLAVPVQGEVRGGVTLAMPGALPRGLRGIPERTAFAVDYIYRLFSLSVRGFFSMEVMKETSGPLGIAKASANATDSAMRTGKWNIVLLFAAFLSTGLAVFNLLPLPALDGGYILLTLPELVGFPKLSATALRTINGIGLSLLLVVLVGVTVLDFLKMTGIVVMAP